MNKASNGIVDEIQRSQNQQNARAKRNQQDAHVTPKTSAHCAASQSSSAFATFDAELGKSFYSTVTLLARLRG
jgi:hypothetical protein